MTNSYRRELREANPYIPKRGRRRNPGGAESSHAAELQVVDLTHVLQFDEGYDPTEQHYQPQEEDSFYQPHEEEDDDDGEEEEVEAKGEPEPDGDDQGDDEGAAHGVPIVGPPFPGGPRDISLLSKYVKHVAVAIWYDTNNVSVLIL